MNPRRLVVITGLSGSGKSLAANCFEDLGYFCVDNLPLDLIGPFSELITRGAEPIPLAALVIDARERRFLDRFAEVLDGLRQLDLNVEVLFFECSEDVLKRRFSETRRPHPLARPGGTLTDAIAAERTALASLREQADRIIDTSQYTSHQLRGFLRGAYGSPGEGEGPNVNVESFGFKYGTPAQVDLLFDVRFLPNPFFVEDLRHRDGRSPEVQAFLDDLEVTGQFLERLQEFLDFLIPLYAAEGKTYLSIGLGCTGGKHRSVALAERIGSYLDGRGVPCSVSHRDLGKE